MPNWCNNELVIEGKPKDLSKLMKAIEITKSEATDEHTQSVFSCHRVIPRPSSEDSNWYEWNIENWGSKWDLSDPSRDDSQWEKGVVFYSFESAWSPVIEVISQLAQEHKKLLFVYTYWEGGADYWGEHHYKDGKEVSYEGGSLNDASCDKLLELIGDHHQCKDCWEAIECAKEDTPELCEECEARNNDLDKELWEGDNNGGTNAEATLEEAQS